MECGYEWMKYYIERSVANCSTLSIPVENGRWHISKNIFSSEYKSIWIGCFAELLISPRSWCCGNASKLVASRQKNSHNRLSFGVPRNNRHKRRILLHEKNTTKNKEYWDMSWPKIQDVFKSKSNKWQNKIEFELFSCVSTKVHHLHLNVWILAKIVIEYSSYFQV